MHSLIGLLIDIFIDLCIFFYIFPLIYDRTRFLDRWMHSLIGLWIDIFIDLCIFFLYISFDYMIGQDFLIDGCIHSLGY